MEKHIQKILLSLITFFFIFLLLTPYFTTDFMDLRQKKENEEIELAKKAAIRKAQEEAKEKIYLLGKFDPAQMENFVEVPEQYNISGHKIYLREQALYAFSKMAEIALKNNVDLKIASATRNFDYQKDIWEKKWSGTTLVEKKDLSKSIPDGKERFEKILEYSAVPGTSRHHWGTDIDINAATPEYFKTDEGEKVYEWLTKNAFLFGFCQTYAQKGSERQIGYSEEKWHWSYLPLSRTFMQEYKNLIKDTDISRFDGDEYVEGENIINNYVLGINPDCI